jgi:hypothetical protein
MISNEALEEFKRIYKEELNEDISDEKAMGLATNLLTLMNVIYRPVKKEWLDELEKEDKSNLASN